MASRQPDDLTGWLLAWSRGDDSALQRLIPVVYQELRRRAHRYMTGERDGHTLQTTDLVHEAYERLVDTPRVRWQDRTHFYAVCAQLMRRILVDHARSRQYQKRGGAARMVSLEDALEVSAGRRTDLVAVDEALQTIAAADPRKGRVVELRFFGGLTVEETAHVLEVSPETVMREWKMAKALLLRELSGSKADGS